MPIIVELRQRIDCRGQRGGRPDWPVALWPPRIVIAQVFPNGSLGGVHEQGVKYTVDAPSPPSIDFSKGRSRPAAPSERADGTPPRLLRGALF